MSKMIPNSVIQEVLQKTDILQVIGDYITLKRAGSSSYKGLCPLHGEKTPSFHVTPSKGLFYCFGCGEGGTALDFVMQMEGLSFPEAVRRLGERSGVEIPDSGQDLETYRRLRRERDAQLDLLEVTCEFFRRSLREAGGRVARDYLAERGIRDDVASTFRLGYAPQSWDALLGYLTSRGVKAHEAEEAGLVIGKERDGGRKSYYDRFRHRLMFPVLDASGKVIAFGGRTLEKDGGGAKYINSPESKLYTKGHNLYGVHAAKDTMRRSKEAILVEGNIDVVKMHQAGFTNTVCPMGTALTDEQSRLLRRFSDRVICIFDGDAAGRKAATRSIEPLQRVELEARVCLMPQGEDPDTYLESEGAEAMRRLVEEARPLIRWAVDEAAATLLTLPLEERPGAMDALKKLIHALNSPIVQRQYVDELARKLDYEPHELSSLLELEQPGATPSTQPSADPILERVRKRKPRFKERPAPHHEQDPDAISELSQHELLEQIERELLRVMLDDTTFLFEFVEANGLLLVQNPVMVSLVQQLVEIAGDRQEIDIQQSLAVLEPGPERALLLQESSVERSFSEALHEHWFKGTIAALQLRWIDLQTTLLSQEIVQAMGEGRDEDVSALLEVKKKIEPLRVVAQRDRKIGDALRE